MKTTFRLRSTVPLLLIALCSLGGCATLSVTPQQSLASPKSKMPATIGIQAGGERVRALLEDKEISPASAASGTMFDKVILLPNSTRFQQPAEIQKAHGVDFILAASIADIQVSGSLNPLWFASIPLLFFKPYAPIVTFEASVVLDTTVLDARTGEILTHKEVTETATDHFSPIEPQHKVRKLISLSINNALVSVMNELPRTISARKP